MKSNRASPRLAVGVVTLAIWALAAGSALYWGVQASGARSGAVPPAAGSARTVSVDTQAVARALGAMVPGNAAQTAAPDVTNRLTLRGVVTHGAQGAALIAVGDKPAKPFRVGAEVQGGWAVKSVAPRSVVIFSGTREVTLNMPALAERSQSVAPATPSSITPVRSLPSALALGSGG